MWTERGPQPALGRVSISQAKGGVKDGDQHQCCCFKVKFDMSYVADNCPWPQHCGGGSG